MAKVSIQLGQPIQVGKVDCVLEVAGVGRLTFSKGTVEWRSSPKSINQRKFTWNQFRKVLEAAGKPDKNPVAKKVKKPAAKKRATKAPALKRA